MESSNQRALSVTLLQRCVKILEINAGEYENLELQARFPPTRDNI